MSKLKKTASMSMTIAFVIVGLLALLFLTLSFDNADSLKSTKRLRIIPNTDSAPSDNNRMLYGNPRGRYPKRIEDPNADYPKYKTLLQVVQDWNPDNPDMPSNFNETLQHFDYMNPEDMTIALKFRDAEVPFKIYNVPEFSETSKKWTDEYLLTVLKYSRNHVEKSKNNHFMYWVRKQSTPKDFKPPTEIMLMDFDKWLKIAIHADQVKLTNESEHYYFMSSSKAGDRTSSFIARDLPLLSTIENNFFISNVDANKGIQCRFSMRGIIAECHYDTGRNMVVMLKGAKRYILNPPSECKKVSIITDKKHPSYRHSNIDWSNMDVAMQHGFDKVKTIDTVVHEGEVLYIPSFWLHYIISLKYSIQCNSRSGIPPSDVGKKDIEECLGGDLEIGWYVRSPLNVKSANSSSEYVLIFLQYVLENCFVLSFLEYSKYYYVRIYYV